MPAWPSPCPSFIAAQYFAEIIANLLLWIGTDKILTLAAIMPFLPPNGSLISLWPSSCPMRLKKSMMLT